MTDDTYILNDAIRTVYSRPDTHGEPEDSFQTIAEKWTATIRALLRSHGIDPNGFKIEPHDVPNLMVDLKTSRNAEGHYHEDNWVDIAGYAENGARLEDKEKQKESRDISFCLSCNEFIKLPHECE